MRAPHVASWTKTWVVLVLVASALATAWWFSPDRAKELRECADKCSPRSGSMVPDSRFKYSFKAGVYLGPYVCSCSG